MESPETSPAPAASDAERDAAQVPVVPARALPLPKEIGGRKNGLEPTRYGDWEKDGRCIDF